MPLPTNGRRDGKITCTPDSLTNHPKALKSLLITLGLSTVTSSPPMWKSVNG